MMHIDLTSKRARLALRFFTYGVMTLATAVLTVVAVFYAMGYRFDQSNLTFTQGGLLQFKSFPEGARVSVDGVVQNFATPGHANVSAGAHTVEFSLDGYRNWAKTVQVTSGQLVWLNYARLLPTTITTTPRATLPEVASALPSPDHKWLLVLEKTNSPALDLVDFNDEKKPVVKRLNIPSNMLTQQNGAFGAFSIKEWDHDSRYVLIQHVNGATTEFIRFDCQQPNNAVNINRVFNLAPTEVHFASATANIVYVLVGGGIQSLDIGGHSASAALIHGVESFAVYDGDILTFVALRADSAGVKQRFVGLYQSHKETFTKAFGADTHVAIAYSEYAHHAYVAVDKGDGTAQLLRDPTNDSKDLFELTQIKLGKPITWLQFSHSGRMLMVGSGNSAATYDVDLDKLTSWTVPGAVLTRPLQWLDDYYVWTDTGGTLRLFEYDGTNDHDITSVAEGLTVHLSLSENLLYSFEKSASGEFILQGSQLAK